MLFPNHAPPQHTQRHPLPSPPPLPSTPPSPKPKPFFAKLTHTLLTLFMNIVIEIILHGAFTSSSK